MTITAERLDLVIQKGARYYQEFQQLDDFGAPIPFTNKTIRCSIKESFRSPVNLYDLTEENGGVVIVNSLEGIFGILLNSNQTNIIPTIGVYDILIVDLYHPTIDSERIVEGKITFSPGVTNQSGGSPTPYVTPNQINSEITITSDYTVEAAITTVFVSAYKAITITLPIPTTYKEVWIKDIAGNAGTYNITIKGAIDSILDYVIGSNHGGLTVKWNGVSWSIKA